MTSRLYYVWILSIILAPTLLAPRMLPLLVP